MTILQLCNKMPYPARDGGAIATLALTESLSKAGCNMVVLAMNTEKHHYSETQLSENLKKVAQWYSVNIRTRLSATDAIVALLKNESYHIKRFKNPLFEKKLIELLKKHQPDWVQLEGLYLTPYIPVIRKHSHAKISFRSHNVEHQIWESLADKTSSLIKRIYLKILAKQLKTYEIQQLNTCDALLPITNEDALDFKNYGCKKPVHVCLAAVRDELLNKATNINTLSSLFFIGSLDWMPNLEGLYWFLYNVWPLVHKRFPALKFYIAGRNPNTALKSIALPNVEIAGEVPDAYAFMNAHGIMLAPLLSGSGVRIKILEGMALRKTIITTTIGAKGIAAVNEREILITDDKDNFFNYIAKCLENTHFSEIVGNNARKFVTKHYDSSIIAQNLVNFYNSLSL